jgi:hypothetical protein
MLQDIQINFGQPISQTSGCELTEHLVDAIKRGDSGSKLIINHPSLIDTKKKSTKNIQAAAEGKLKLPVLCGEYTNLNYESFHQCHK